MVPDAQFASYYGRPVIKEPAWKVPDVPVYLFLGGLAGASAVMAEAAWWRRLPATERVGRYGAAVAAAGGVVALVHDLGRPQRFLNMLRVIKPTSPLSVGSWILAPFSGLAVAAAASRATGVLPPLGRLAGVGAAVLGAPMTTYTAVLLADTAIPAWHEGHRELPFVFSGSSMSAAAGLALLAVPPGEAAPARALAATGAAVELASSQWMTRRMGFVGEPYRSGRAQTLLRTGERLTAAGVAGALVGRGPGPVSRAVRIAGGAALLGASLVTRFGIFAAGPVSARDPRYVVEPQRSGVGRPPVR